MKAIKLFTNGVMEEEEAIHVQRFIPDQIAVENLKALKGVVADNDTRNLQNVIF